MFSDSSQQPEGTNGVRRAGVYTLGVLLTLGIGLLDFLTGIEISFSVFYLVPTVFLAWRGGRGAGIIAAAISAVVWLGVEASSDHLYSQPWIMYWNATVRLVFFVSTALLISRQKLVYSLERKLSRTDSLTGLMNVRSFFQEGERVRILCARHARPLTVVFMDLDNFKQVNDRRGHPEGDRLIQLVGRALQQAVRGSDLAARLGGDEFALLLPEAGFEEAEICIGRLRQCLEAEVDRGYWSVSYSVGVVTFPTPPADLEVATARADQLMYEAKSGGKDRWIHRMAEG